MSTRPANQSLTLRNPFNQKPKKNSDENLPSINCYTFLITSYNMCQLTNLTPILTE